MKIGDLVLVTFGRLEPPMVGIFLGVCEWARDTRGYVFWDNDVTSVPLCQIEVINEAR